MTAHTARLLASIAGVIFAAPGIVSGQTTPAPQTYVACHIPLVGVIYKIKEPGLPAACLSRTHVEFAWNKVGPKGDQGEQGERGVPGNLALAGQGCPTGFFVSAFNSTGSVVCRNLSGQEPTDPPPPPPPPPPGSHPLNGEWTLAPVLTMRCGPFDVVSITVDKATTRVLSPGLIRFTVEGTADNRPFELPAEVPLDQAAGTFAGSATSDAGGGTFTATFSGEFTSNNSFTVSVSMSGNVTSIPFGDCRPVTASITGTRM